MLAMTYRLCVLGTHYLHLQEMRTMPGPAPKANDARRRTNALTAPGFRRLPFEGRSGPIPQWPLSLLASEDEHNLWLKLWRLPQAVMWERLHCEDIVALYVRAIVEAQRDPSNTKLMAEVRQLDSKVGLSPKAMLDLRWEVEDEPEAEEQPMANVTRIRSFVPAASAVRS